MIKQRRDEYLEEHKSLTQSELQTSQLFDKTMISLSSGALALSITFIQNIAPEPSYKIYLFIAWACFILSLLSTLASLIFSQDACRRQREINEKVFLYTEQTELENKPGKITDICNRASICLFVVGMVLLSSFTGCNLRSKKHMDNEKINLYQEKGFVPQHLPNLSPHPQTGFIPQSPPVQPQPPAVPPKTNSDSVIN